jgi:acyl-CoA dehydrogenase
MLVAFGILTNNERKFKVFQTMSKKNSKYEHFMETLVISDEILAQLTLNNRNKFLNNNLAIMLEPKEMEFLNEVQEFCCEFQKNVDHSEDLYSWFPAFGKKGYICRLHSFQKIGLSQEPWGLMTDFLRHFAVDFFDPQFSWGVDASVLAINPLYAHYDNIDVRTKALKELVQGEAVGCVCITEPERGSDATHQLTTSKRTSEGLILNGVKVFNTNAPRSKYAIVYATSEANNPETMTQSLVQFPNDHTKIERVFIPAAPRVWLGKETFTNLLIPNDQILGDVGKGKEHMFEGLVPERIMIALLNIAESWNAITHASIYANLRKQMDKEIIQHQGVGFTLADIWAHTANLTRSLMDFCRSYDKLMVKHSNKLPGDIQKTLVTASSQLKYDCTKHNVSAVYECMNLMAGAGVCDNTLMWDLVGSSRVQEIVGGTRQIQQYIMSSAIRNICKAETKKNSK